MESFGSILACSSIWKLPNPLFLMKHDASYSIGTCEACDVQIPPSLLVEEFHCTIQYDFLTGMASIRDRSAREGTWVNGRRLESPSEEFLLGGEKICLGSPILPGSFRFSFSNPWTNDLLIDKKYSVQWGRPLGGGTFGVVWKARKRFSYGPKASRRAIKVLHSEPDDYERKAAIANEIEIAKALVHPNICSYFDSFEDPVVGKTYLVLELVEGVNLEQYVRRGSANGLGNTLAKCITKQICSAVAYMHSCRIVHRDLKPSNILLSESSPSAPTVKIADFGLSKKLQGMDLLRTVCGTPEYAAPEVVNQALADGREGYDESIDGWSIGVVVYFMMTSGSPFSWPRATLLDVWKQLPERDMNLEALKKATSDSRCYDFVNALMQKPLDQRLTVQRSVYHAWLR